MWKEYLKDYFVFTKKERSGIIILLILIFILTFLPVFFPFFVREEFFDHSEFEREVAALVSDSAQKSKKAGDAGEFENDYGYWENNRRKITEFYFDPNTASQSDWLKLGISPGTAATIQKYISRGGKFKVPGDLHKIYGLGKKDAARLLPFVRISEPETAAVEVREIRDAYAERPLRTFKTKEISPIDINEADTLTFTSLPGIGSRLAKRIVNYRNALGGFYSVRQVGETYFLPDSTFRKILPYLIIENKTFKTIDINSAQAEELKLHPYIRYSVANAIVEYRKQHGNFNSIEEIKKVMIVTDSIFSKMAPYLVLE